MSLPTTATGLQVNLQTLGFYKSKIDGAFGNASKAALLEYVKSLTPVEIAVDVTGKVDERSEKNIATLRVEVQGVAREFIRRVNKTLPDSYLFKITSGTRTYAEQNLIFQQATDGKDSDGDGRIDEADERVTKAPAGYSNHNFGIAFDVTLFKGGIAIFESPLYQQISKIGIELGLSWGGVFNDEPHYALRPAWAKDMSEREMIAELRNQQLRIA